MKAKPKTETKPQPRDIREVMKDFTAISLEVLDHPQTPVDFWNALTDAFDYLFNETGVGGSAVERIEVLMPITANVLALQKGGRKQ